MYTFYLVYYFIQTIAVEFAERFEKVHLQTLLDGQAQFVFGGEREWRQRFEATRERHN